MGIDELLQAKREEILRLAGPRHQPTRRASSLSAALNT